MPVTKNLVKHTGFGARFLSGYFDVIKFISDMFIYLLIILIAHILYFVCYNNHMTNDYYNTFSISWYCAGEHGYFVQNTLKLSFLLKALRATKSSNYFSS